MIDQCERKSDGAVRLARRGFASLALLIVAFIVVGAGTASAAGCGVNSPIGETAVSSWSALQADVSAVASGSLQTFYLSADIANNSAPYGQLQVAAGASVTIDLNGCNLSITAPGTIGDGAGAAAISVPAGSTPADDASLTIEDSSSSVLADQGTLTASGGNTATLSQQAGGGAGIGGDGGDSTLAAASAGKVTVDGGNIDVRGGSAAPADEGGGGAGIGGGGGGVGGESAGGGGGALTVDGGAVSAPVGGAGAYSFGGGGAGIGGGGGGGNSSGSEAAGGNGGAVLIDNGSVTDATGAGGGEYGGGQGAGIGGGGAGGGDTFGGSGGTLALSNATLTGLNAAFDAAVTGGGEGASIEAQSGTNSLSGQMDGPFTIDQGATVTVGSEQTLEFYEYTAINNGTIDLAGQLTGGGELQNLGSITVSGDGWSADGRGPNPVAGPFISGNAFDLQFSLTSGSGTPADEWVFAPTLASSGEVLPPVPTEAGYVSGSDWTVGGAEVDPGTSLAPLASNSGVISLSATETAIDPTITASLSSTIPEGSNGEWYAPVTVTFTCTTPAGTTLTCPAPVVLSTSGQGQSVSQTVTASNGATASVTMSGINIDLARTAMIYEIVSKRSKSRWGWWSAPVTVQFTCTTPSGTTLIVTCPTPIALSTNGQHQGSVETVTNSIGETASVTVPTISIDTTRPKVTIKGPRANATYTRSAPKASCHATDGYSGIASCILITKKTKTGRSLRETITASATNRAGTTTDIRIQFRIRH